MTDATKTTKGKRKARTIHLRFRKNDPSHNLLAAAQHWIKANGGTTIMLGGIGLIRDGDYKYQICIGALGQAPKKEGKNAD